MVVAIVVVLNTKASVRLSHPCFRKPVISDMRMRDTLLPVFGVSVAMPLPKTTIAPVAPVVLDDAASVWVAISTRPLVVVLASAAPALALLSIYALSQSVVLPESAAHPVPLV